MNPDAKIFKWCDIELFSWDGWDTIDTDELTFYDCKWFDEGINKLLDQYYIGHPEIPVDKRSCDVEIRLNGYIHVEAVGETDPKTKVINTYTIYEGWIINLPRVHSFLGIEGIWLG